MRGVLTFTDGRTVNFDFGLTHPLRTWVEIVRHEAVIRVSNLWIPDDRAPFEVHRQAGMFDQGIEVIETPGENQMVHMPNNFVVAVHGKKEAYPNSDEAVKTLRVLDALAKSGREGREVDG